MTGRRSITLSGRPHPRQCERGWITDSPLGTRSAARLMKLPVISATRTMYAPTKGAITYIDSSKFFFSKSKGAARSGALLPSSFAIARLCDVASSGCRAASAVREYRGDLPMRVPRVIELGRAVASEVRVGRRRGQVVQGDRTVPRGHVVRVRRASGEGIRVLVSHVGVERCLHRLVLLVAGLD